LILTQTVNVVEQGTGSERGLGWNLRQIADRSVPVPFPGLPHLQFEIQRTSTMPTPSTLAWTDVDRRIWEEELEDFVPLTVFDAHTHLYLWDNNTDPHKADTPMGEQVGAKFPCSDWAAINACDATLLPDRRVHRLSFPYPFPVSCDFRGSNRFVLQETAADPSSAALMLVHPSMTEDDLETQISQGFLGFKPYRFYSATGDAVDCRITDFLPEHQIGVADRHSLIVMLHLSRRDAVADRQNLDDLVRLGSRYPRVQWVLAHCARSYSDWPIRRAMPVLRTLPNVWYDTSSVCESDAIQALLEGVGSERVMYGSDNLPVGAFRGKYVSFGYAWAYLSESNQSLDLLHCEAGMSFTLYEQLRAMRRAARRMGLAANQVEAIFSGNATRLIQSVRRG